MSIDVKSPGTRAEALFLLDSLKYLMARYNPDDPDDFKATFVSVLAFVGFACKKDVTIRKVLFELLKREGVSD